MYVKFNSGTNIVCIKISQFIIRYKFKTIDMCTFAWFGWFAATAEYLVNASRGTRGLVRGCGLFAQNGAADSSPVSLSPTTFPRDWTHAAGPRHLRTDFLM